MKKYIFSHLGFPLSLVHSPTQPPPHDASPTSVSVSSSPLRPGHKRAASPAQRRLGRPQATNLLQSSLHPGHHKHAASLPASRWQEQGAPALTPYSRQEPHRGSQVRKPSSPLVAADGNGDRCCG